jgi:hypothetical protein
MASDCDSRDGGEIGKEQKVRLLRELAAALTRLGVGAELVDEPGLTVSTPNPGIYMWVIIANSGQLFTWRRSGGSHPVDDVAGAAVEIAKCATEQNGLANGGARA